MAIFKSYSTKAEIHFMGTEGAEIGFMRRALLSQARIPQKCSAKQLGGAAGVHPLFVATPPQATKKTLFQKSVKSAKNAIASLIIFLTNICLMQSSAHYPRDF